MRQGASYGKVFTLTNPTTGASSNADSLPTAIAYKDGVNNSSNFPLIVANVTTGVYKITGTIPSDNDGTRYDIVVSATVSTIAANAIVDKFEVSTIPTNPLLTNDARLNNLDATISSRATQVIADNIYTEVLTLQGVVSEGIPVYYYPTAATRTIGSDQGGTYTALGSHDEVMFATGEVAGTGLDVVVTIGTTDIDAIPMELDIHGYYNGGSGHQINVYVWNYTTSVWESKLTMLTRTSAFNYAAGLNSDHHNATTGELQFRFQHSTGSYNSSHRLYLDSIRVAKAVSTTSLSPMVADIKAKTDQLNFVLGDVVCTLNAETVAVSDKTGFSLTSAYDAAKTAASQTSVDNIPTNPLLTNDVRLDNIDVTISSRATQISVDDIPTNPLLTDDTRLDNLDVAISSRSTQTSVDNIPINPLLTNDVRLDNLDTTISSRSAQTSVDNIPINPLLADDVRLDNLDTTISSRATQTSADDISTDLISISGDITSISTDILDIPQDTWEYATRTLTSGSSATPQDIWEYTTRSLTTPMTDEATPRNMAAVNAFTGFVVVDNTTGSSTEFTNLLAINESNGSITLIGKQGTTWLYTAQLLDSNSDPYDLTGYSIRAEIRKEYKSANPVATWTTTITDEVNGQVSLELTASETSAIPAGHKLVTAYNYQLIKDGVYYWDVEIYRDVLGVEEVTRCMSGKLIIAPEVTK